MTLVRPPSFALLALLPAAGLALGGIGLALSEALREVAVVAPLPAARPAGTASTPATASPWPALFGTESPDLPQETQTAPPPEDLPFPEIDTSLFALRGLINDAGGDGLAVIETPSGVVFARPGDVLDGGVLVGEILDSGVELILEDLVALLEFDSSSSSPWIGPPDSGAVAAPPGSLDAPSFPSYTPGQAESGLPANPFGITR